MNNPLYQRTAALLGEEATEKLRAARLLVLGVGGVGAYTAELLVRAGARRVTFIDGDRVEATNFNRQLLALNSTLGDFKARVMAARAADINPAGEFTAETRFLRPDEAEELVARNFDAAADAIDDVPAKLAFLAACVRAGTPVVSAMGAGGKRDPAAVRAADISKTFGCPLARRVRAGLRELGINHGVSCVFSPEERRQAAPAAQEIGTVSYLPALFGAFLAAEVLRLLGVTR